MATATTSFSPAEAQALAKFNPKPFLPGPLDVGAHDVDCTVRLYGTIVVSPGYEQLTVGPGELHRIIYCLRPHLKKTVLFDDIVARAMAAEYDTAALKARIRELVGQSKPKTPCAGSVRGDLLTFTRLAR